jgi:hypothetical protein
VHHSENYAAKTEGNGPWEQELGRPFSETASVFFCLRLLADVDRQLRSHVAHRRGSLASMVVLVLNHTDLRTIPIQQRKRNELRLSTSVRLPRKVYDRLRSVAKSRKTAMNLLINSAIAAYFTKPDLRH